ncbi:hypothetical protein KY285_023841 [Solanum tuberosum]|nr:hypothetical protein KY285_023841 [Solanum tuberosum]
MGHLLEKKRNRILIDKGFGVNILPIHTLKELGITTEELSGSCLLIQGFNQGGQRGKSTDVKPIKSDKIISKRIDVAVGKVNVDTKELVLILTEGRIMSSKKLTSGLCYVPKVKKEEGQSSNLQENAFRGLTLPIRRIDAINLSSKLPEKSIAQNQVRDVALPTKCTREGFDPNAYKLFAKAGYYPNELSMLRKLPSEDTTRKAREGLEEDIGYAPPELEEKVKTTIDPLKEVNHGTDEYPRPTYLSAFVEVDEEIAYMNILEVYRDVFAWSYKEKLGLNPKVAVHQLAIKKWFSSC